MAQRHPSAGVPVYRVNYLAAEFYPNSHVNPSPPGVETHEIGAKFNQSREKPPRTRDAQ